MNESSIMKRIQIRASQLGMRLFRINVAKAWVGESVRYSDYKTVQVQPGDVVIHKARRLHSGVAGMSDLIGWDSSGRFVAIEVKTATGRATAEQKAFLAAVSFSGGRAMIARSESDIETSSQNDLPTHSE